MSSPEFPLLPTARHFYHVSFFFASTFSFQHGSQLDVDKIRCYPYDADKPGQERHPSPPCLLECKKYSLVRQPSGQEPQIGLDRCLKAAYPDDLSC